MNEEGQKIPISVNSAGGKKISNCLKMKQIFIKNIKPIDKSRWRFSSLPKQNELSPYFPKISRQIRVKEIVDDLNEKHFLDNMKLWVSIVQRNNNCQLFTSKILL